MCSSFRIGFGQGSNVLAGAMAQDLAGSPHSGTAKGRDGTRSVATQGQWRL